jgi:formamidase
VYEADGIGKVGIMICADGHVPEVARNLAMNGAEIILKPALQPHWIGNVRNYVPVNQTRAIENQCFVVAVNHPAPIGMGHSCLCDPEGRLLEELGETDSFIVAQINMEDVRQAREQGFAGCFPLLKMVKTYHAQGIPFAGCYTGDICEAPIFKELDGDAPMTPDEFRRYGHQQL